MKKQNETEQTSLTAEKSQLMRQLEQLLWLTVMRFKVLSNKECSDDCQASPLYINSHINQFKICVELIAGLTANEYLKYTFESQKCTLH